MDGLRAKYGWRGALGAGLLFLGLLPPGLFAQPVNDDFGNRTVIAIDNGTIFGTLSNATSEAGEPLVAGVSSGQTAWWTWTAPFNGILALSATATNFDPFVTVYTGERLPTLSLVASNNYLICYDDGVCGCHWRMRGQTSFHVVRGQAYQISVDSPIFTDASIDSNWEVTFSTNIAPGSDIQLSLNFTPAPANDDFANAKVISGQRIQLVVSNYGASKEPGEPDHDGNPGGSSVWYSWVAPASGRVTLSTNEIAPPPPPSWYDLSGLESFSLRTTYWSGTCGNAEDQNPPPVFYPLIATYTGVEVSDLTSNYLPVDLTNYPYAVEFEAVRGERYHIAVDGNMGTTSNFTLYLALTPPAINDKFAGRIKMRGVNITATGYNDGAQPEPGAPNIGNGSTGELSWWTWTAPLRGPISISLAGSDYTFPIAVFTGSSLRTLQMVASGSGGVSFAAKAGAIYQIAVGDADGLTGNIVMLLQP